MDGINYHIDAVIHSIVRVRNWTPTEIGKLYLDDMFGGIFYFFDDILRENAQSKK